MLVQHVSSNGLGKAIYPALQSELAASGFRNASVLVMDRSSCAQQAATILPAAGMRADLVLRVVSTRGLGASWLSTQHSAATIVVQQHFPQHQT
jgi:hypothetical protein